MPKTDRVYFLRGRLNTTRPRKFLLVRVDSVAPKTNIIYTLGVEKVNEQLTSNRLPIATSVCRYVGGRLGLDLQGLAQFARWEPCNPCGLRDILCGSILYSTGHRAASLNDRFGIRKIYVVVVSACESACDGLYEEHLVKAEPCLP